MRRLNSKFITRYISEQGNKKKNKDYFGFVELDDFACWVLAQGYDNDPDCISAKLVVDVFIEQFIKKPSL